VSFDVSALGRAGDERSYVVGDEALRAYAAATDDVPGGPVFAIVPVWETIAPASRSVASDGARQRVVHYEQDLLLHRPIVAGMKLRSRATPVALLARPKGTSLVIHTETRTEDGTLVNEQFVTEFFRGIEVDQSLGERAPDHRREADGEPLGEVSVTVAADQSERYAAASGDDFAIHLDDEFARSVGLPGRVVHGLCTMALAGRSALSALEIDDPSRVRRLAVRFSAPLFPGETLTTHVWRTNGGAAFESFNSSGTPVLKDGLLDLRRG
jgi:acyl dehydratase